MVCSVHADEAARMIRNRQAVPAHAGKRISEIRLPAVPVVGGDSGHHGGNSNRQHRVDVCDGGATLVIETDLTLPRTVVTQSCRVMSLKPSNPAFGEVMRAERAELSA